MTIHFVEIEDNVDHKYDFTTIPGTEICLKRRVERSNEGKVTSKYFLDDKITTYLTVIDKLSQFGIDLNHNRFLILQGEVEKISLMKPKSENKNEVGLLEYLEDIIGSNSNPEAL